MNTTRLLTVAVLFVVAIALTACGGSKAKEEAKPAPAPAATAAPVYPACNADGDCASNAQVCVEGTCKQCRDNGQCASLGPCGRCEGNTCVNKPGCCTTDAECNGGRCRAGQCR